LGDKVKFTQALWIDAELIDTKSDGKFNLAKVRLLNNKTPNDLLKALIPHVEIHALHEEIPSMSDVFIARVNEINNGEMEVVS
jgi:ABC-2 type transport system ATP-binding protein